MADEMEDDRDTLEKTLRVNPRSGPAVTYLLSAMAKSFENEETSGSDELLYIFSRAEQGLLARSVIWTMTRNLRHFSE